MPIVISQNLVVRNTGIGPDSPLIGYDNRVAIANVSATTEASGYPASNLANPATFLEWRADDTTEHLVTVDLADNMRDVDYLAICRHNLGTIRSEVSVEVYDGSTWSTACTGRIFADDAPVIFRFTASAYEGVRLRIKTGAAAARIAVLFVGKLLEMPRKIYVGHAPLHLQRAPNLATGMSESGNFLGRIMLGETAATTADFQNLPAAWVRQYLQPFLLAAQTQPFFWAWRPAGYPREHGYCWLTATPKPSNQRSNGMMQVSLQLAGIVA